MIIAGKLKMVAAATAALVVASSGEASPVIQTGNVQYNSVNGTCQPNPLTGFPWATEITYNVAAILSGTTTSNGQAIIYVTLTSPFLNESGATQNAYSWVYAFNETTGAYSLSAAGIPGSATVSGTFAGGFTEPSGNGPLSFNLKLNCGATLVGATAVIGL